jgi:hypothetical protein
MKRAVELSAVWAAMAVVALERGQIVDALRFALLAWTTRATVYVDHDERVEEQPSFGRYDA